MSAVLGNYVPGPSYGDAPLVGVYLILTGVWFGLVIGFAIWNWAARSWNAATTAFVATWMGWELAVNAAIQLDDTGSSYLGGLAAGAIGAFVTWAGAAAHSTRLRAFWVPLAITSTGAVFGLLLPSTNHYDSALPLLVPWQIAVASVLGSGLACESAPSWLLRFPPLRQKSPS